MGDVILLVDDDENFPLLLAWENFPFSLRFVFNGEQAIQYLCGKGKYADRAQYPFPHLLLLDLNMPRINGFEFLEWKGKRPELNSLPVVVWSSSELVQDKQKAMSLGAHSYISKPPEFSKLVEAVRGLERYCRGLGDHGCSSGPYSE
jgi:CheY-like chemotaxis protein